MAFNNIMQIATAKSVDFLPKNPTVVEFGNQRFRYNPAIIDEINKNKKIRKPVNHVWEFFEDLGFSNYLAIDINTELRAIAMDLNFNLKEKYNYEKTFDYVTNNGTGEHIFDQRAVFENMHNLCKVNGLMINVLPLSQWLNHGFYNFNLNLFRDIAAANEYEWCFLWLAQNTGLRCELPFDMNSVSFYENKRPKNPHSDLEKIIEQLQNHGGIYTDISIVSVYKKIKDHDFNIPMQGRYVDDVVDELKLSYSDSNLDTRQSDHHSANY